MPLSKVYPLRGVIVKRKTASVKPRKTIVRRLRNTASMVSTGVMPMIDGLILFRPCHVRGIENRINEADRKLLRMQNAAPLRELFKRESARISEKAREDTRNKLTEWRQKREGNAERTRLTNSISKTTMAMQKWIAEPNTKPGAYVPDMLVSPLGKLLEGIDLQSRRSLNGGEKPAQTRSLLMGRRIFCFCTATACPGKKAGCVGCCQLCL